MQLSELKDSEILDQRVMINSIKMFKTLFHSQYTSALYFVEIVGVISDSVYFKYDVIWTLRDLQVVSFSMIGRRH